MQGTQGLQQACGYVEEHVVASYVALPLNAPHFPGLPRAPLMWHRSTVPVQDSPVSATRALYWMRNVRPVLRSAGGSAWGSICSVTFGASLLSISASGTHTQASLVFGMQLHAAGALPAVMLPTLMSADRPWGSTMPESLGDG